MMNLLITGAWGSAQTNIKNIEAMGHKVMFMQQEKDTLPCTCDWVEGVICNGLFLFHPIEDFVNLRYIQLTSAGYDRVPMNYVREQGIEIHNARGVYSIPMAEFAITGVLQLYKQMRFFAENQKQHKWIKHRGLMELFGKTVCIVGCGSVGTECAKRFQVFGCHVIGIDLFPHEDSWYEKMLNLDALDLMLPEADIVILTLPLTEETRYLVNDSRMQKLKDSAILVNISRGGVIDTQALIHHAERLGGAILDVFEEEPLDDSSPLWNIENVMITPHNSFVGIGNIERLTNIVLENVKVKV